ncbi:hypothetical protein D9M70_438130 [compost metagenome]
MRLASAETVEIALVDDRTPVQDDEAVGAGFLQVAGERQGRLAEREGQVVEVALRAVRQRQRRIRPGDVAGRRELPRMAGRPAQVGRLEGVGLGDALVRRRREALHDARIGRQRGLEADGGEQRGPQQPGGGRAFPRGSGGGRRGLEVHCWSSQGCRFGRGAAAARGLSCGLASVCENVRHKHNVLIGINP